MNKFITLLIYSGQKEDVGVVTQVALKRLLDIFMSILLIILLSPLLILVTLLIKLDSCGPIIYKRKMLGYKGQLFDILKFRTMYMDSDDLLVRDIPYREEFEKYHKLKNDPRVTRVGRFLRKHSLDELPQLFNVISGEMSIVGPRPIHPDEIRLYDSMAEFVQSIRPGMTGLWQVSGRSNLKFEERVRLDVFYVCNWSFRFDIELLLRTLPEVIQGSGAY